MLGEDVVLFVYVLICSVIYYKRLEEEYALVESQNHFSPTFTKLFRMRNSDEDIDSKSDDKSKAAVTIEKPLRRDQQRKQQHQAELEAIRKKNLVAKQKRENKLKQEVAERTAARLRAADHGMTGNMGWSILSKILKPISSILSQKVYFYGELKRQDVQRLLQQGGNSDGLYLISQSINFPGDYELAVCCDTRVHHYLVRHLKDNNGNTFGIEDGLRFRDLESLVRHYEEGADGLCCRLVTNQCRETPSFISN